MKRNKFIYVTMAAASLLAASCTDFSDFNEAYQDGQPGSDKTLWENISERPELSDFASLLTKVGFDKELSKSRFYTVWAPQNGTFDFATYDQQDSATLVDRFVKNNVADYNYVVSSPATQRLAMLNEKVYTLQNETGITFAGNDIIGSNIPSSNGTLYITQGAAEYLPSIYQYIFDQRDAKVDTAVADYLGKYENNYFDEANSVVGPIDTLGQQTYIDSVFVLSNAMTNQLRAYIDNEDSVYTMLMPTDHAYKAAYDKILSYYKYPKTMNYLDFDVSTATTRSKEAGSDFDEELGDSITSLTIASSLFYSHGNYYNYWLDEVGRQAEHDPERLDSLESTSLDNISNGEEMISHTMGDIVTASNGYIRRVDTLAYRSWDLWCPEINVPIFDDNYRPARSTISSQTVQLNNNNFNYEVGDYIPQYLYVTDVTGYISPTVYFYIPNVRSAAYNVYVVLAPSNIQVGSTAEAKICSFNAKIGYMQTDGGTVAEGTEGFNVSVTTDSASLTKIDTMFVGTVTFPYAYAGIEGPDTDIPECMPYMAIASNYSQWMWPNNTWASDLRIAGIILRPVEYDEYLKNEE